MAGTFIDKATLATDNAFINKCRAAMIFRAVELIGSASKQSYTDLAKMSNILQNAGAEAPLMAWRVAAGNSTIGAAAPAMPIDSDVQFAVNTFLTLQ